MIKYITIDCVRCGSKFRYWTKGNIYTIVCQECNRNLIQKHLTKN